MDEQIQVNSNCVYNERPTLNDAKIKIYVDDDQLYQWGLTYLFLS